LITIYHYHGEDEQLRIKSELGHEQRLDDTHFLVICHGLFQKKINFLVKHQGQDIIFWISETDFIRRK